MAGIATTAATTDVGDTITLTPDPKDYLKAAHPTWRQVDWAAYEHQVVLRNGLVNYVDIGAGGQPCVLLHGHGGRWQCWLETLPALAEHRRVIALDLPGFGRSALPPRPARSMDSLAGVVEELATLLDLGAVDVVGHSMGTLCAIESRPPSPHGCGDSCWRRAPPHRSSTFSPTRSASVAVTPARRCGDRRLAVGWPADAGIRTARVGVSNTTARAGLRALLHARRQPRPRFGQAADRLRRRPGYYSVAARAHHYDPRPAQHGVQCPVMLINGADDSWVPVADIEHLRGVAPVAVDIRISPARHLLTIEWPALLNQLVTDFLDEEFPTPPIS
jgi:pimeloyl-ACP methyl ester carboxylesterase